MPQWGFVGPAYQAANPGQDNQACVNWYVEIDPNTGDGQSVVPEGKVALGLLGVPGLVALSTAYSGAYRGGWALPGNQQGLFVIGNQVILAKLTGAGSNGRPNFTFSQVGALQTSVGWVNIRDNGAGKIAAIVDGTTTLYVYNFGTGAFSAFANANGAYLGATNVAEIDGRFIFNQPGTQKFFTSPVYWDGATGFDATYFALKDNASDNLVALIENHRELWLVGEATTEPWFNAGGPTFPFSRIDGGLMQIGCAAPQSIARTGKGLMWLATSERGGLSVIETQGYEYQPVSTPAVAWALNQYPVVSDALGYIYSEEGHSFYVLTLPSADVTWVYDLNTKLWHQRASFDPTTGLFHRQRVNGLVSLGGMQIGGDYLNGRLYWQTRTAYADDQYPLVAMRRSPHVWDKGDRNRVTHSRLQVDFFPGVGLATGQGSDPQAMLRWSDDGGQTWGNEHWTSIGQLGQTKTRAIWRRLGSARDRVYEVRVSDPVKRDVAGASLQAGATAA